MIVIIDYGVGNLRSILSKFERLKIEAIISTDADEIRRADKLVFPGIGHFEAGMANLDGSGLVPVLEDMVMQKKTPLLGICLGMQLLTRGSEESSRPGLGWVAGEVKRFDFPPPSDKLFRVPHMGWNQAKFTHPSPLITNIVPEVRFYFAHSYYVVADGPEYVVGMTWYGHDFVSIIHQDNIWATQFHPEKSHQAGLQIIRNFAQYA
jgi:glutamine amidotransferase